MQLDSSTGLPRLVNKFLRYVRIDTQSDPLSDSVPSTEKQKDLSRLLLSELQEMGYSESRMDEHGYVFCTIPAANTGDGQKPVRLGLLAHVDTAPDESGTDVKPIVHPPYRGGIVVLPGNTDVTLDPKRSPGLLQHLGERLISSDGTTLLGSDDKAGVAILMQLAEDLRNDSAPRPEIRLCFTIDEEIGRGGTDGSRLSEKGLPTPNIFNGGYDYHSLFEWNTVENLQRSLAYTKQLVQYWGVNG